jgi:hypothetical protein
MGFIILFIGFFILSRFILGIGMAFAGQLVFAIICAVIAWTLSKAVMN